MAQAFDQAVGIVVDTHVRRITQRLGFTDKKTPEQIEKRSATMVAGRFVERLFAIYNIPGPEVL